MLNNKGFAVSSVLYTLLIAFLLFLGAALAQFSTSSSLIGKANDDIVNGNRFSAVQVKAPSVGDKVCGIDYQWFQNTDGSSFNTLVRINSKYGTMYWPKDFGLGINPSNGNIEGTYHSYKNIDVSCLDGSNCEGKNIFNVTYADKKLDLNLTSSTSSTYNYNGGIITINGDEVDKFKNVFNKIKNIEMPSLSCSTMTYKNFDHCKELFDNRDLTKTIKNGKISFFGISSEWIVYQWDLEEPILFTYKNEETNESNAGKINKIFYTYIVLMEENESLKNLIGNSTNNLDFYFDDDKLFTYQRERLNSSINNLDSINTVTTEQKLKITNLISGRSIDNFGLYDICQ